MAPEARTYCSKDCAFPEGPRWHDGPALVLRHARPAGRRRGASTALRGDAGRDAPAVLRASAGCRMAGSSSCRWRTGKLLRQDDPTGCVEAADLSSGAPTSTATTWWWTPPAARTSGTSASTCTGRASPRRPTSRSSIPDGRVEVAAEGLCASRTGRSSPPTDARWSIGESFGCEPHGLRRRRGRAALESSRVGEARGRAIPDGICLDAEGAASGWRRRSDTWCSACSRGGEVTHRVTVETEAFACMLGGPERRHLFVCTAGTSDPKESHVRSGRIEVVEVDVPGDGLP